MPITISQLLVEVGADTTKAQKGLKDVQGETKNTGNFFTGALGTALDFAGGLATAATVGFGALSAAATYFIAKGSEADEAQARLNSAIADTGKVTGVTSQHATDLATAMMGVTRYDDQAVQGAESIIARFSNIGATGGIFDQTTKAALDVSTALGKSLPAATKIVAKAIDDPIKGLSALHSIGIDFTDQQKAQVKALEKSGQTMQAQQIILDALKAHYGGTAEAAGKTFPGMLDILHNKMDNVAETIGQAVTPALTGMLSHVMPLVDEVGNNLPGALNAAGNVFTTVIEPVLKTVADAFGSLGGQGGVIAILANEFQNMTTQATNGFGGLGGIIPGVASALKPFLNDLGQIAIFVTGIALDLETELMPPLTKLGGLISSLVVPAFKAIQSAFDSIDFSGDSGDLDGMYAGIKAIGEIFNGLVDTIGNFVIPVLKDVFTWFSSDILPIITRVGGAIMSQLAPALHGIGQAIQQAQPFLKQIEAAFKSLLPAITIVAGVAGALFAAGMAVVVGAVRGVIGALGGLFEILGGLATYVHGVWDIISGIFTLNGAKISQGLNELSTGIKEIFAGLFRAVLGFLGGFVAGFFGFLDALSGGALGRFGAMLGGIVSGIASLPGRIAGGLGALVSTIGQTFNSLVDGAGMFIAAFIQRMIDGITGAATSFGSSLHKLVSSAVHAIPVIGSLIPAFAGGGLASGTVLVGDQGPELVTLPAGSYVSTNPQTQAALSGAQGGSGKPMVIVIEWDGRVIAEKVLEYTPELVRLKTGTKI